MIQNFLIFFDTKLTPKSWNLFFYNLLLPISYLIEKIIYWKYWNKIILPELLNSQNIVDFINNNEFVLMKHRFVSFNIIEKNTYLDSIKNSEELNQLIKGEFIEAFAKLFSENLNFDMENYLNIYVHNEYMNINGVNEKTYFVELRFYRFDIIEKLESKLIWYFVKLSIMIGLIYFGISLIQRYIILP